MLLIDISIRLSYNICMSTQTFNLSLPEELVKVLDAQAKRDYSSRSEYVRKAIINQLRSEQTHKPVAGPSSTEASDSDRLMQNYDVFKKQYGQTLKNLKDR